MTEQAINHGQREHSRIGASGASRWMHCSRSPNLQAEMEAENPVEEQDDIYSAEGTLAHELSEMMLLSFPGELDVGKHVKVGDIEPVGKNQFKVKVTKSIISCVNLYIQTIWNDIAEDPIAPGHKLNVEKKFQLACDSQAYGANDASYISESGVLRVYDLKAGAGIVVEVEDNPQLMYYGVGAYYGPGKDLVKDIELVVVQPRIEHADGYVRRDRFGVFDLEVWYQTELKPAIARVREGGVYAPEQKRCRYCPAASVCPQLEDDAFEHAKLAFGEPLPEKSPKPKDRVAAAHALGDALGQAYLRVPLMKAWISAVEDATRAKMLADPTSIEELKLIEGYGNREWIDEATIKTWMTENVGKVLTSEPKLLSPNQLEEHIKDLELEEGVVEQWIGEISNLNRKPKTGARIAKADAKGEPYVVPTAKEAFSDED